MCVRGKGVSNLKGVVRASFQTPKCTRNLPLHHPHPLSLTACAQVLFSFCLDRRPSFHFAMRQGSSSHHTFSMRTGILEKRPPPLLFLLPTVPFLENICPVQLFRPTGADNWPELNRSWWWRGNNGVRGLKERGDPVCCFPRRIAVWKRNFCCRIRLRCEVVTLQSRQTLFMGNWEQEIQ